MMELSESSGTPKTHPVDELGPDVETALARALVADSPLIAVFHVLMAVMVAAFLSPSIPLTRLAGWVAAIAAASLWRTVCRRRLLARNPPPAEVRRVVRWNMAALALAWGTGAAALIPRMTFGNTALILVIFSALISAAVVTLFSDRPAFFLFTACLYVPLAGGIAARAWSMGLDHEHSTALLLIAVFSLFASSLHGRVHQRAIQQELDISERLRARKAQRQAEEAHLEAERSYRELVESASDLVCRGDAVGRWSYVNPAAERIYGLKPEQLIGRPFVERSHPDFRQRDKEAFQRVIDGGEMLDYETVHLAADGTPRYLSFSVRPVLDAAGRFLGAQGIARDVTERALAAQAVREAHEAAELAARTRSEFLANMSHEVRTPMNAMLGLIELLLETPLSDEQRRSLGIVRISAENLLALLNDILELSRIEAGKIMLEPSPVDLQVLLESVASLFGAPAHAKGIALIVDIDPALPRNVRADPTRLRQVLTSLLGNAIKFTPQGQAVLAAQRAGGMDALVEVRFTVSDTGIGISPTEMSRIFEPFSQADASSTRRYGGTGLGLALARRIVRRMGSDLEVSSHPGEGSVFFFTLSLPVEADSPRPARPAMAAGTPPRRELRILLAEDNLFNQEVATAMLRKRGHIVDVASNGREAVEAAERQEYDLILMDIQMPEMDGFAATTAIHALPGGARIPIVACTAHALDGERERCLAAGMNGYLAKPYKAQQLFAAVEEGAELRPAPSPPDPAPQSGPDVSTPVDVAAFRQSLEEAGAGDAVDAILATFVREAGGRAAAVAAAVEGDDGVVIARAAHAFKSAAASISARRLAALLAELEAAGKAGNLSACRDLGRRLHTESDAVLHYLRSLLEGRAHV